MWKFKKFSFFFIGLYLFFFKLYMQIIKWLRDMADEGGDISSFDHSSLMSKIAFHTEVHRTNKISLGCIFTQLPLALTVLLHSITFG